MLLLQGYFAAINASLLVFNRLAALGRVELVISMMEAFDLTRLQKSSLKS
jgi:hypothetical protein